MLESKEFQTDRWDNSLPNAFDDFKDINFDQKEFRVPFEEFGPINSDELLSICMLRSLGQTGNLLRFKNPFMHMEKFGIRYREQLKQENFLETMIAIYDSDNTANKEFTRLVSDNIVVRDPQDSREIWRETVSYSIIYSLNSDLRTLAITKLEDSDSAYEIVRDIFNS